MPFALSNRNVVTRGVTEAEEQEKSDLEGIEVHLLTEGIYQHYGFDFRDYSLPSLRRRIWKRVYAEGLATISALQEKVLHDSSCMERLLLDLSIKPTAMFRPSLRENVVFAQHNLVTDASFNHFNVIFCRNVLIYFNNRL